MKLISVPILYHTKESETLENCGILVNEDNLEKKQIYINIDQISAIDEVEDLNGSPIKHTGIHINGDLYLCSLPIDKVLHMINEENEKK